MCVCVCVCDQAYKENNQPYKNKNRQFSQLHPIIT